MNLEDTYKSSYSWHTVQLSFIAASLLSKKELRQHKEEFIIEKNRTFFQSFKDLSTFKMLICKMFILVFASINVTILYFTPLAVV